MLTLCACDTVPQSNIGELKKGAFANLGWCRRPRLLSSEGGTASPTPIALTEPTTPRKERSRRCKKSDSLNLPGRLLQRSVTDVLAGVGRGSRRSSDRPSVPARPQSEGHNDKEARTESVPRNN
eukprot:3687220-Prymnesium_polylepis.1